MQLNPIERLDVGNDDEVRQLLESDDETLRQEHDRVGRYLSQLGVMRLEQKAHWLRWSSSERSRFEFKTAEADYFQWQAELQETFNEAKAYRDMVSEAMRLRVQTGAPPGHSIRTVLFKLVSEIYALEQDPERSEQALFDLLDTCNLWASGKSFTVREWLTINKARW